MAEDEGGALHFLHDICHGEGLARARHTEQHLRFGAVKHPLGKLFDGLGLVARGLVF